jgi:hypothetical protein
MLATCLLRSWALAGTRIGNAPVENLLGQRRSPSTAGWPIQGAGPLQKLLAVQPQSVNWVLARVGPDALDVPSAPG